jgi:hypothetical protein
MGHRRQRLRDEWCSRLKAKGPLMFLKAAKLSPPGSPDVKFTAADLNDTIVLYRRVSAAESRIARAIDQSIEDGGPGEYGGPGDYGRLPPGAQGPHSPTD